MPRRSDTWDCKYFTVHPKSLHCPQKHRLFPSQRARVHVTWWSVKSRDRFQTVQHSINLSKTRLTWSALNSFPFGGRTRVTLLKRCHLVCVWSAHECDNDQPFIQSYQTAALPVSNVACLCEIYYLREERKLSSASWTRMCARRRVLAEVRLSNLEMEMWCGG